MKFKVLHGLHYEGKNSDGKAKCYKRGDVVDSASDLDKKFNSPGSIKFERVPDSTAVTVAEPELAEQLEKMTVPQLREFAAEHEIEIDSAYSKKSDVIDCIIVAIDE